MFTGISVSERKHIKGKTYDKMNAFIVVFDFLVLWYYFFSGTLMLRPMVSAFWIFSACIGMYLFGVKLIELNNYNTLCLIGVIAIFISIPSSIDIGGSAKYAFSILMYFLISYQLTKFRMNMYLLLKMMIVYSVFLVSITFIQAHFPEIYTSFVLPLMPAHFHERILVFMSNKAHTGFYNQTSANAVAMSLGCILSMYIYTKSDYNNKKLKKLLSIVCILIFLYGLILTNRRGSSIVVCILMLLYCYKKMKKPYLRVMLVVAVGVFIASGTWRNVTVLENLINKTEKYASEGDVTNGRLEIWINSIQLFWRGPIFGYGADTYGYLAVEGYAHNSYLQSLVEIGLIGSVLFYVPFFYGFVQTIKLFRNRDRYDIESKSIIEFCLYWQAYCLMNALFESFFASEISVFMFYITQMMCIQIQKDPVCDVKRCI